jgi:hypothetical protein
MPTIGHGGARRASVAEAMKGLMLTGSSRWILQKIPPAATRSSVHYRLDIGPKPLYMGWNNGFDK